MLEKRISLLQTGAVDADMLAETARSDVGLYAENDVIITIPLKILKF
jgi:cell division protein FtsB